MNISEAAGRLVITVDEYNIYAHIYFLSSSSLFF